MNDGGLAWHAGERALHARAGVRDRMEELGARVLRDHMPDQHRSFFAELPLLYAGTLDAQGQPWAWMLAGPPGFVDSPTPQLLRVRAAAAAHEAWGSHLETGAPVGLLGLQAHTRRRNRMNGWVSARTGAGFEVSVAQSFGNCPRHVQPREALHAPAAGDAQVRTMAALDPAARRIIGAADTFFIATAHPQARTSKTPATGLDVSHRGGAPGFARVQRDGSLLVPDYAGNSFFNTFGNLQLEPRCGLLFIDFTTGARLQLAADAEVIWEGPELASLPGALRALRLHVGQAVLAEGGLPLAFRPAKPASSL